ncbi:hypothetical protein [Streptomyces sp. NPDC048663]|uniref:hypothetical protein n=1 Tax=Streptomyces sp. NPDC048663 TaxID=3155638 RepID=UPI00343B0C34
MRSYSPSAVPGKSLSWASRCWSCVTSAPLSPRRRTGAWVGRAEATVPGVDADRVGAAGRDAVPDGLALTVGDAETVGDALAADTDGTAGARPAADVTGAAAEGDPVLRAGSGTPSLTSLGAAVFRCGTTRENSPPASPATARTPATATAAETVSTHRGTRRRAGIGTTAGTGSAGGAAGDGSGAGPATTGRNGMVSAPAPVPSPPRSTYGRIRSGSKSSAAACSALRASRSASDARRVQSHEGVLSAPLGAPHSGHR